MKQLKSFLFSLWGIFAEQRDRFILWVPVFIAVGTGTYFSLPDEPALWSSLSLLSIAAVFLSVLRRVPFLFFGMLAVFLIILGFAAAHFHTQNIAAPMLEKRIGPVQVSGICDTVTQLPKNKGWRVVLSDVSLEKRASEDTPKRVRLQIYKKAITGDLKPGMRVSVLAILNAPSSPVMPEAFDFRRHMFFEEIGGTGYAIGPVDYQADHIQSRTTHKLFWEGKRKTVREKVVQSFPERPDTAALITALLAGDRDAISDDVWTDIRTAGLAHLLAISGLHIGLIAGFLFFMIRASLACSEYLTLRYPIKKISAVLALLGTVIYLLLVGAPISAQRATIMTGIVLVAVMLDRDGLTLRLAAVAATVILLLMPHALLNAGFHMSFAAVVSLIAFYEALSERWKSWHQHASAIHRLALYFFSSILTTVVASLATAPFSLFHFHRVADEFSVWANIIAVPLTAFVVMPAGLLALILMPFGLQDWPLQMMGFGVEMIYDIAHDLTISGDHMIEVPAWSLAGLLLMVFGGLWLSIWRGKVRLWGMAIILLGCVVAWISATPTPDIYISDRGDLLAVRLQDGAFALSSTRKDKFVANQWQRHAGWTGEKTSWDKAAAQETENGWHCTWLYCALDKNGYRSAFVKNPLAFTQLCDDTAFDVLIAPRDVIPRRCKIRRKIDRFDLWDRGGHVIFLAQSGIAVKTVAKALGARPWVSERFKK